VSIGLFQILVVALVLLVLFGRSRIGRTVSDIGEGVKRLREDLADDEPHTFAAGADVAPLERTADADKTAG
jgi:sec-independent protein translocase protein TatA